MTSTAIDTIAATGNSESAAFSFCSQTTLGFARNKVAAALVDIVDVEGGNLPSTAWPMIPVHQVAATLPKRVLRCASRNKIAAGVTPGLEGLNVLSISRPAIARAQVATELTTEAAASLGRFAVI